MAEKSKFYTFCDQTVYAVRHFKSTRKCSSRVNGTL